MTNDMTTDFEAAVERHRRELHVHCYRMLGSFEEAEDALQEALLRAWRARATLADESGLRAWLYKIATNVCLDAPRCRGCSPIRTGCWTRSRRARRSRTPSSSLARRSS
jgi:RNA polymerase sigma factor (sigma-70 family)